MSKFVFLKDKELMGVTPVENIFISQFMPAAPELAVKAYLCGLMQLTHGLEDDVCAVLGCTEEELSAAYSYWEKLGLVEVMRGESRLSYEPLESCEGLAFERDARGRSHVKPDAIDYWNYLCASYWAIDAGMMRDMAAATGRDASKYAAMEQEAKDYIRESFLNEDGSFKTAILNTMQTPALFALKNKLFEGEAKDAIISRLRDNFAEHGNCLQTGFLGTSILMDVLTDNGMSDIAYELLLQRKNPSWIYSIDNGATTIWERWNSYTLDKGMGPKGMNSFNHYAYGAVCAWIWKTAAGIAADASQPGFKHIIMKPVFDPRLGSLDAEYKSVSGTIKSSWKYEGDKWVWNFTIPEGATASVTVPGETAAKEYGAGSYTIKQK